MEDFSFYFVLGWQHIISLDALDHILFITALAVVYSLKKWKQVLILVTAFTIGHSLTLLLSTLDVVRFSAKWVEFLIPLTIIATAVSNVVPAKEKDSPVTLNYYFALFFGLVHGMGFANSIRFMLAGDQHIATGLFGFNVGLEAGQLLVVSLVLILGWIICERLKINRRVWVMVSSFTIFAFALKMTMERFPK